MARINLTPGRIKDFSCPAGKQQAFLWDEKPEGFGVRATAGSKSFIFQGKLKGKVIRITIGDPKNWLLDEAREKARIFRTQIDEGRDPRIVKAEVTAADIAKRERQRAEQAPAKDAWTAYVEARASKWSDRYKATHEQMARKGGEPITRGKRPGMGDTKAPGMLWAVLELPLAEITRDRVKALINDQAATRPESARMGLALLRGFLSWAGDTPEYRDQVHLDACARMGRELPATKAKEDCLQREQLGTWFNQVLALPNPVVSAYLQALLLTGARRNELSAVRWVDVDFQWKSIAIRDKVEGERTIPLTPYVESLLLKLNALNTTGSNVTNIKARKKGAKEKREPSPWVFFSDTAEGGRIQEPRLGHNKALAAAGLPALSIHGLRRSFGTLAEWVECPAGISAQIMGHKPSAIAEKHYRRRPLDLLRMWHSKIEGWILDQAGIEQPSTQSQKLKAVASI